MARTKRQKQLRNDIVEVVSTAPEGAKWGVAVLDARTLNVIAGLNTRLQTEALSLSKLALTHVMGNKIERGSLAPEEKLSIQSTDVRPGGFLGNLLRYEGLTVQDMVKAMLRISDTTGQRALVRKLGGPKAVDLALKGLPVGVGPNPPKPLFVTGLQPLALLAGETKETARFFTGSINPFEAALCFSGASKFATARHAMRTNIFPFGLRRDLPKNIAPPAAFLRALDRAQDSYVGRVDARRLLHPLNWRESPYANMMGIDEDKRHDVAQIGSSIIAALSEGYDPDLPEDASHPAHDIHAELGKLVLAYEQSK